MTPINAQPRPIADGAVNAFLQNDQSLLDSLAGEAARRGIIVAGGKTLESKPNLLDGRLDLSRIAADRLLGRPVFDIKQSFPTATSSTSGDPQIDGLVQQITKVNGDIDQLLADYQKAVSKGEDTFAIQTKIQQAMQQRLELTTLLSNIQKMNHDAIMAIVNNIR